MFKFCQNNVLTISLKKFLMNILTKILIFIFVSIGTGFANEIKVFNFTTDELSNLEVRKVRGAENKTIYKIGSNENGNFLKAVADNAASGLGKEVKIDLNKTPFINITYEWSFIKVNFKLLKFHRIIKVYGPKS